MGSTWNASSALFIFAARLQTSGNILPLGRRFRANGQLLAGRYEHVNSSSNLKVKMQINPMPARTPEEQEQLLGQRLRTLRVHKNLDQVTVSARAGISVRSLRNLESGDGSSLRTLIKVLRVLGRETWLETIAPVPTINPNMMTRKAVPRQRASGPRLKKPA